MITRSWVWCVVVGGWAAPTLGPPHQIALIEESQVVLVRRLSISSLDKKGGTVLLKKCLFPHSLEHRCHIEGWIIRSVATSAKSKDSAPYIITGLSLGGSKSSPSHVTASEHARPDEEYTLPPCITSVQQAVLRHSTWNSCFLHVVLKDRLFPKIIPSSSHDYQSIGQ
ncbi:hypothetical protein NL676_036272 [Syzygium grande]|nr:hypothetical protein NL676_036272 [Syzygium grande]